jgi:hypothetical protein
MAMNRRVTVFLRGGLGNQMFQYAAGLNLAKKNNARLFLDTTFLNDRFPRKEFTYRTFDLDIFTLLSGGVLKEGPRFTALSKVSNTIPVPGLWLGFDLLLMKVQNMLGTQRFIKEEKYRCNPETVPVKGNVVLYGRWQSEKYFIDSADDVRNSFHFRRELSGEAATIAQQIKNSNSVSIHVRRGDYVNFENMRKIMGDTDLSYYAKAVSYMAERVAHPHFFVFSDDIAWCREKINAVMSHDSASLGSPVRHEINFPADSLPSVKIPFLVTYCDEKTAGPKNAFHLELMSLCRHNIIANSTFSWWAAWLNRNPGKIVVSPRSWHKTVDPDGPDIIPEGWERM